MVVFRLVLLFIFAWLFGCNNEQSFSKIKPLEQSVASKVVSEQWDIFDLGEVRKFDIESLERFVNQSHAFKQKPEIYFFFVDTLRKDKLNIEDTPNLMSLSDSSLVFKNHYSSSTVTHSSTYGIFMGILLSIKTKFCSKNGKRAAHFSML